MDIVNGSWLGEIINVDTKERIYCFFRFTEILVSKKIHYLVGLHKLRSIISVETFSHIYHEDISESLAI